MFNLPELADFLSSLLPTIHSAKYFICSINRNIHKTCCKGIQLVWELVKSERKRHEHINRSFSWTVEETTHFICLLGSKKKGPNKEAWQVPYSSKPKLVKVQVYFYRGLQEKKKTQEKHNKQTKITNNKPSSISAQNVVMIIYRKNTKVSGTKGICLSTLYLKDTIHLLWKYKTRN